MMLKRIERPKKIDSDMWVDEAIWGHRLYDEQTPWLCFMEFLNILYAENLENRALTEPNGKNKLAYISQYKLYLRNILFNNPKIESIQKDYKDNSDEAWNQWFEVMDRGNAGIANADFTYLKKRFSSFEHFFLIVKFLKETTIEGENNKRWSSQFVFPYGPDCLYEDLRVKDESVTSDRRFFARTGELLYLMLARSNKESNLLEYFQKTILDPNNKYNRLVAALESPNSLGSSNERTGAYLPYENLREYEELANDWLSLMSRNIPNYDILPHLVNMMGLHLIIYSLNRAKEVLNEKDPLIFIIEIISPKKNIIRNLSSDSLIENNKLSGRAVEAYIRNITESEEWKTDLDIFEAKSILMRDYEWPREGKEESGFKEDKQNSVKQLIDSFVEKALIRHKQHGEKFHNTWSKEIGLASRRGTKKLRYAPQDSLIKSLVICLVSNRMEFQEFLEVLYKRYGFIIGDKQAHSVMKEGRADLEAFAENAKRLEQRLASMGLLRRLSDACAYVENPFR